MLAIGTLNRESTFLLLPLLIVEAWKHPLRSVWISGGIASVLVPYVALRMTVESPRPVWWTIDALAENIPFISPDTTLSALAANLRLVFLLGPFLVPAFLRFERHELFLRHTASIIPLYVVVHYLFGKIVEIRLWVPLLVVLIPLALSGLRPLMANEAKS